jgi:single-strand DNA-binding protein
MDKLKERYPIHRSLLQWQGKQRPDMSRHERALAMPQSLNRIELIGRLGADPKICSSEADLRVCTFWLVTEDLWKDQTGTVREAVEWHRVVTWDRLAEDCHNSFVRGDLLYVEGHLTTRAWHDTTQQSHTVTELVAERVILLHRDPQSPDQRDSIFIPANIVRENEPYMPPSQPDLLTQKKLSWGISKA